MNNKGKYCKAHCPYLEPYIHPFYHHTAWCSYQLRDLTWYDGHWVANCLVDAPNEKLLKLTGRLPKLINKDLT